MIKKSIIIFVLILFILSVKAEGLELGGGIGVDVCVGETCEGNQDTTQTQETTFTNSNHNSDSKDENTEILTTQFFNSNPTQLQEIKLSVPEKNSPKINLILSLTFVSMLFLSVYLIKFVEIPNNTK